MTTRLHIAQAAALAFALLAGCREDPEQAANKLFVEASPLWAQYQALPQDDPAQFDARLKLLNRVDENLRKIVSDYPESSLAVEIISSGQAKSLDISIIKRDIGEIICASDVYVCAVSKRLEEIKLMPNDSYKVNALAGVAGNQALHNDLEGASLTVEIALETAKSIIDEPSRSYALSSIVRAQIAGKNFDGALNTAKSIADESLLNLLTSEVDTAMKNK